MTDGGADPFHRRLHATSEGDVVVLDKDAVGEIEAVVGAAADPYPIFLQHPQPRRGLSGVADAHRVFLEPIDEKSGEGGDTGDTLQQVERGTLSLEKVNHRPPDREQYVTLIYGGAVIYGIEQVPE